MKDPWVKIGYIANTYGIHGDLKVASLSYLPDRLKTLETAFIGEEKRRVRVIRSAEHKGMVLLRFEGYEDINRVLPWKGQYLYVAEADIAPLPQGAWYVHDLIGMHAIDRETGTSLGTITDVIPAPANDVLVLKETNGTETLVAFVEAFVGDIDTQARTIQIMIPEVL